MNVLSSIKIINRVVTKAWTDRVVGSLKKACAISLINGQNCQEILKPSKLSSSSWWVRHSLQTKSWSFLSFFLLCWRNPNIQNSEKAQTIIQGSFGIRGWSSMKKNEVLIEPAAAQNANREKTGRMWQCIHSSIRPWLFGEILLWRMQSLFHHKDQCRNFQSPGY